MSGDAAVREPASAGRMRRRLVAVVGPADAEPALREAAREVGRLLAEAGCVVVTGGGDGVMAAASEGAASAGGTTLAFLPGSDPATADPWSDVVVATGWGEGRDFLVVRSAQVVVAVGGSWGTLAEVALARRAGTPVVGLDTWTPCTSRGSGVEGGPVPARDAADAARIATSLLA